VYVYIHTYTHTYMYIYTHTRTCMSDPAFKYVYSIHVHVYVIVCVIFSNLDVFANLNKIRRGKIVWDMFVRTEIIHFSLLDSLLDNLSGRASKMNASLFLVF